MELPSPTYKNCLLGQKMNENIALPTNKRKFTLVKNFTKYKISSHKALIFQWISTSMLQSGLYSAQLAHEYDFVPLWIFFFF